jgi:hypothetical protein
MLIISKFHDYYDAIARNGVDKSIIFIRNEQKLETEKDRPNWYKLPKEFNEFNDLLTYESKGSYNQPGYYYIQILFVLFCGKCYPIYRYSYLDVDKTPLYSGKTVTYEYIRHRGYTHDLNSLPEFIKLKTAKESGYYRRTYSIFGANSSDYIKQDFTDLQIQFKSPIAIVHVIPTDSVDYRCRPDNQVIINPCLKNFGFQVVKDPFSTFQEIQSFISGVMGGSSPPMVEIEDKYRIDMHGFDKHSFRSSKRPG